MPPYRHKLSEPPLAPKRGVKAATHHLLFETAMTSIHADGHIPSVVEVALHFKVSRATAYRVFPSRSGLITSVVDTSPGPVRSSAVFERAANRVTTRLRSPLRKRSLPSAGK